MRQIHVLELHSTSCCAWSVWRFPSFCPIEFRVPLWNMLKPSFIIEPTVALIAQIYFVKKFYMFRAEELPKTCRVSWQNEFGHLVRLLVLFKRNLLQCTVTWTKKKAKTENRSTRIIQWPFPFL